jgi:uncharacterized protein YebE (UPF0316 family)
MGFLDFFLGTSVWVYIFIFFGKIIEVAVSTVRLVLIARGERVIGSCVAFFEIMLWLFITGTVLSGFQNDWVKILVFGGAFAVGNYVGSWLENKLAFGLCSLQVIVTKDVKAENLVLALRRNEFGLTITEAMGMDGERLVLILNMKRKRIPEATRIIQLSCSDAVITVSDLKVAHGGYLKSLKK